jgi:hypothetical protein
MQSRAPCVTVAAMKRLWSVAAAAALAMVPSLLLGGCGFDGSSARLAPDGAVEPDAAPVDAPPLDGRPSVSACAGGFKVIGASSYLLVPAISLSWDQAFSHCRTLGAHLVTFETAAEVAAVTTGLPLAVSAWTGVLQTRDAPTPYQGWFNRIGGTITTIPIGFPWRAGEPNDFVPPETNDENFGELLPSGTFDDAPQGRLCRVLCECALTP